MTFSESELVIRNLGKFTEVFESLVYITFSKSFEKYFKIDIDL